MNARIRCRDLRADADTSLIEATYHEVLEPSFSPDELDPLDTVLDGLAEDGSYECWGLCALDGETPVGCILGYPYPESRVLLIGYVVVRPGGRNRGVGGLLMDEARRQWYGKADLTLVVAEIDDPRFHPVVGDIDPERRVAFYARHGTQIAAGPYFQPRLEGEGKKRVYDMFLAVLYGSSGAISPGPSPSVSAPQLAAFLREYFPASGEDSDWPTNEDAEGRWLLDWYRGRETIALHPISGYREIEIPRFPGRPAR
jgi:GNAT superfamily N-acetyltransferase